MHGFNPFNLSKNVFKCVLRKTAKVCTQKSTYILLAFLRCMVKVLVFFFSFYVYNLKAYLGERSNVWSLASYEWNWFIYIHLGNMNLLMNKTHLKQILKLILHSFAFQLSFPSFPSHWLNLKLGANGLKRLGIFTMTRQFG